jgi:hypothetical protein
VQGIQNAFGGHIKLLQVGVGACLIVIIAIAGVGLALYRELGVVDRKVSALQRSIEDAKARIDRMNVVSGGALSGAVGILKEQALIEQSLARIESVVLPKSPNPIIALTPNETAGIRAFFRLTRKTSEPPRFKLGDKIPSADVKAMPDIVYEKIAPQFKETNFLIDQNGALVVTASAENLVVYIVEPT